MAFIIDTVIKQIAGFVPKTWKVREETKAQGEAQLAVAEGSVRFWQERMGWSPEAARYLATAFAFGIRENVASVLEKAQELSLADDFSHQFLRRAEEDASIIAIYARVRPVQRRLTDESAQGCMLMARRVVRTKTEQTLVLIARTIAWSGSLTTASLVTPRSGRSRWGEWLQSVAPSGDTPTRKW